MTDQLTAADLPPLPPKWSEPQTALADVPQDRQLADAKAALAQAAAHVTRAREAEQAAHNAYDRARRDDPTSQATDDARDHWAAAWTDLVSEMVALERARDEVRAIHRQAREVTDA